MSLFRPKTHGYGASPSGWKGWAAIAAFVVAETLLAFLLVVWPILGGSGPDLLRIAIWCVLSGALTFGFLLWVRARTDGEWRWRWGQRE